MTRDYIGRVNGPAKMKNFRGMNPASSEINQDPNGGIDIVNCDLSTIGSIKLRKGWTLAECSPALPIANVEGIIDLATSAGEALIVFCNGQIFRVIGNNSENITGSCLVTTGYRWRGCQSNDHVYMANGKNQPVVVGLTGDAVTYSEYSIANSVTPAIPVDITINTPPDSLWNCTAHTLVNGDQVKLVTSGTLPAPFVVGTTYFVVGALPNTFQLAATLGGAPITYTTAGAGVFSYSQVGVDQTPSSWVSKPPIGFVLLNQLGAERMWAWNYETAFFSALYEPWNYVAASNAGFIDIRPGDGDSVVAVTGSYGYVAIMTLNRTLIYNGTGPDDLALNHVLPMGCTSPDSLVTIGDDIVFLSPYGPSNLKRFINGTQLIQNMIGFSIAPLMHDTASLDGWKKCVAYHDINNRRAIWWLPQGDMPNQGFVYQYDVQSWTRFADWSINCATRTAGNQLIAGGTEGKLMILNTGGSDGIATRFVGTCSFAGDVMTVETVTSSYPKIGDTVLASGVAPGTVVLSGTGPFVLSYGQGTLAARATITTYGVEISAHYTTAWFDKGEPERNMTCPFMEIWLRASGVRISLTANWDQGELVDAQDVLYVSQGNEWGNLSSDQNVNVKWWGVYQSDTDPNVGLWGLSNYAKTRQDVYGIGRSVQFTFQMNGSGEAEILAYRPDLRSKGLM